MKFRNDINGLRAIAVIAVVLFHFNAGWLPGGFAGVDVFFVISGFLMTGIIFRGIEQNNFSILNFYIARANRIIPALAALCITVLVLGYFFITPIEYAALAKHVGNSMIFLSNIEYWRESGYFDTASHGKWLLHTWSLSVEWQFYIIYPMILVGMRKYMTLRTMKLTLLFSTILGFIFCIIATYKWPNPAYYLLPTRAWEMMIGGVAFIFPWSIQNKHKKIIEWLGLSMIVGTYLLISKETPWPGYIAIFPVLGAFLVIQSQRNDSMITSNLLFQKLGAWSYSIYLWHWPLVVAIYYFSLTDTYIYSGILLSVLLGFLSNKYIERLKFNNQLTRYFYFTYKPLYMTFIIGTLSLTIFLNNGDNYWLKLQNTATQKTYAMLSEQAITTKHWGIDTDGQQDFSECRFNIRNLTPESESRLETCASNFGSGTLILGDSHAIDLFGMVSSRFNNDFIVGITSGGCRVWNDEELCQYANVKKFITEHNYIFNHVIYEQAGFYLLLDENGDKGSRYMFDKLALTDVVDGIDVDVAHVDIVTNYLSELSEFVPITWFGSRFEPHFTDKQILENTCDFNFKLRDGQHAVFDDLGQYINTQVDTLPNVKYVSQNKTINYQFPVDLMSCENIYWSDVDHLSSIGEERFGQRLPDDFLTY